MKIDWLSFLIYSLAVFRLATLFSLDSGPFAIFRKLRSFISRESKEKENKILRASEMNKGIQCIRCSSLELAIPVSLFTLFHPSLWPWLRIGGEVLVLSMALSGAAILAHRILPSK